MKKDSHIKLSDFKKADIRSGIIVKSNANDKLRNGACDFAIDFGGIGLKNCRVPIAEGESVTDLIGLNVVAVMNPLQPIVLAVMCPDAGPVLLTTTRLTRPGSPVLFGPK